MKESRRYKNDIEKSKLGIKKEKREIVEIKDKLMCNNYWSERNEFIEAPIFKSTKNHIKIRQQISPIKQKVN